MDVETLLLKFSPCWRNLFGAMSVQGRELSSAISWLDHELSSKFGDSLNLNELALSLTCEEPLLDKEGKLIFKPRLLHFPLPIQRTVTAFLEHHSHLLTQDSLHSFTESFIAGEDATEFDDWVRANITALKERYNSRTCPACCDADSYSFSQQVATYASDVLQQLTSLDDLSCTDMDWADVDHQIDSLNYVCNTSIIQEGAQSPLRQLKPFPLSQTGTSLNLTQDDDLSLSCSQTYTSQTQAPKQELTEKMMASISRLKNWLHSPPATPDELCEDMSVFNDCPVSQLDTLCEMLELSIVPEVAVAAACHNIVSLLPEIGYSCCLCFSKHCLLPKVQEVSQNASWLLHRSLTSVTTKFPRPVIESVFKECITASSFNTSQSEVFCRLVKDNLSPEDRIFLISSSLQDLPMFDESHLSFVQCLVECKVDLNPSSLTQLLTKLEQNSLNMAENKKFGKLLLSVMRQYQNQFTTAHLSSLSNTVRCLRTFLKKTCEATLNKLHPCT